MKKQLDLRTRVYSFYEKNKSKGKSFTIDHFVAENCHDKTIRRIIERFEKGISVFHQKGAGRIARKITNRKKTALKAYFNHKSGVSQRSAARKFNISLSYVNKLLKEQSDIRCRKRIKIPLRTEAQKHLAKTKYSRLYRKYNNFFFVLDDESYFTLSHSTINGNNNFYSNNIEATPPEVKYRTKYKFEPKVPVWIAGSSKGLSEPFIVPSVLAVSQKLYQDECLNKRLIAFLNKYHSSDNYVFWPDLASSHYAKSTLEYLRTKNVNFVQKEDNPANVPEIRTIEDFWSVLKGKVYEKGWAAKNIQQLEKKILKCIKKIDIKAVQDVFSSTIHCIDKVRRQGVREFQ